MSTIAKPEVLVETRKVYCQSAEAAALLARQDPPLETLPLPERLPAEEASPCVVIGDNPAVFTTELHDALAQNRARLIYILRDDAGLPAEASGAPIFSFLTPPLQVAVVASTVRAAFDNLDLWRRQGSLELDLLRARSEIDELNQIGIALSTQRDTGSLLDLILRKSREITTSDAGSLYLVEETEQGDKRLRFKLTQNESLKLPFTEFTVPINASSIAGYVALTGESLHLEDVYQIPPALPFRFNPKFDQESGYRTKSMLVVPMKNPQGEIIGVVQLINCKRAGSLRVERDKADAVVIPYPDTRRALVSSLASQAAVAIENARLYESIETLFEGFVKASVVAIEARDPTTSGHSFRVADLTVGLAEAVDRDDSPAFRTLSFTRTEMKEIRYASLLHDFGKVGVREEVLVKAKKLYPLQYDLVRQRFDFVRKSVQQEHTARKLAYLLERGREEFLAAQGQLDHDLAERLREMDEFLEFVLKCNEPTVLPEGNFQRLVELAAVQFSDWTGDPRPLITGDEMRLLSIPKGSLDDSERKQIESHVVHSFNFLSQIPWTKDIRNIPSIARAHHEKLNGAGYPYKLTAAEIPFQSKMMTISDIYDALSASDRPYKKAVPTERALDILKMEANQLLIDAELFRLFTQAEIYRLTADWKHPAGFNL
ncbi:MAG: HD domain-containing phosphohydrolase [Terriglobia bacterium]